ncbi:hypothetical protein V499_03980 [Pseudogymnoascus sp. VKM F-103]|nr:hypothetical protein V499_03980 [Pseudogymnoascus sp. VKM F-103]
MASNPPNPPNPAIMATTTTPNPSAEGNSDPKPNTSTPTDADDWTPAQKEALQAHLSALRTTRTADARLSLPPPNASSSGRAPPSSSA